MEKKRLGLAIATMALPMAFAQSSAIDSVLDFMGNIFRAIFNPSLPGLAIFLKFVIIVITFTIAYEMLPARFGNKGPRAIISLALGLGAGLAIPTELALTTGAFYGSLVVALLILLPFLIMIFISYQGVKYTDTNWVYPGLILGWVVYFILLAYFLAHVGTLPAIYEWVQVVATILLFLSPLIILVLLGIMIAGGEEEERPRFSDMLKKWNTHEIKEKSKKVNGHFSTARTYLNGIKSARSDEQKKEKLRRAIREIREAKNSARAIAAQAAKLFTSESIPDATEKAAVEVAQGILGDINGLLIDLQPLTESRIADIEKYITDHKPADTLKNFIDQVTLVSQLTIKNK